MIGINKIKNLYKIKFVKDTGFTFLSHIFIGISGLLLNTIIGRYYGVADLGIINQSLSFYMIFTVISNFGVQASSQKHASQFIDKKDKLDKILSSSILATILISIPCVLSFQIILSYFPNIFPSYGVKNILAILIFIIPVFSLNKTMNNFISGLRKMILYSSVKALRWLLIITGLLICIFLDFTVITFSYFFLVAELSVFLLLLFNSYKYLNITIDFKWIKTHLIFGMKSWLAEIVDQFNTRIPIIIIGYIMGDVAAGYYSYIEVFAFSVLMISGAIQKNFNPVFTSLWYKGHILEIKNHVSRIVKIMFFLIPIFFIGISVFYYSYTLFFMTEDFLIYSLFFLMMIVSFISFTFSPFSTFLVMSGDLNENLLRVLIYALSNIIFTIIFVNYFNLIGAPLGFITALIINLIVLQILYLKKLNFNLLKSMFFEKNKN